MNKKNSSLTKNKISKFKAPRQLILQTFREHNNVIEFLKENNTGSYLFLSENLSAEEYQFLTTVYELLDTESVDNKPTLSMSLYKFAKAYRGRSLTGGSQPKQLVKLIYNLYKKEFLFADMIKGPKKVTFTRLITEFTIEDRKNSFSINDKKNKMAIDISNVTGGHITIEFHPMFIHGLTNDYVLLPPNIRSNMVKAYEKIRITKKVRIPIIIEKFIIHLYTQVSFKQFKPEITELKLFAMLSRTWLKASRIQSIKKDLQSGIEIATEINILKKHDRVPAKSKNDMMYIFYLNEKF